MKSANPFHSPDQIDFLGTQEKRSKAQIKEDDEITRQFVAASKGGIPFVPVLKKTKSKKTKK